jgi:hypothetical protein
MISIFLTYMHWKWNTSVDFLTNKKVCEEKYVAKICSYLQWTIMSNKWFTYPNQPFWKHVTTPQANGHWLECNEVINLLVKSCYEIIQASSYNS